jgi:hypothetical protein
LYGVLPEAVTTGFVSPEKDAKESDPHDDVDKTTLTAFVDADPLVVHESCRSHFAVSVQSVAWLSGPCRMNMPTVKLYLVTSPPGECDQHKV